MKTTILWLATLAGITLAVQQASAADQPILSCITETAADGTEVRDCEYEVKVVLPAPRDEPMPGAAAVAHEGGKHGERDHGRRRGGDDAVQ